MEKILLVDDDLQIVKHLNSYLRENGYHLIVMMIVMILTFKLGLNRFRKQNNIETLKDDM